MATDTIVLPNAHEFTRQGMDPRFTGTNLGIWRDVGSVFADLAVFWGGDDKLVISPRPIPQEYIEYVRDHFNISGLFTCSPRTYSSMFCRDILADSALMDDLVVKYQWAPSVRLHTWGATEDTYLLIDSLAGRGVCIEALDIPRRPDFWSSLYLDSKAGFRLLCTELRQADARISMPQGFICDSLHDALETSHYFHGRDMGCVLKANMGVSGLGILVLGPEWSDQPKKALETFVFRQIRDLPYFRQGPIIVERHMRGLDLYRGSRLQYGSVFFNAYVSADKQVEIFGGGRELRNGDNFYVGALLGKGGVPVDIERTITPIMQQLCEAAMSYDYCGHIGVDFLIDESGTPLLLELNPRRCGESHVYDLASRLYGPTWSSSKTALTRLPVYVEMIGDWQLTGVLEAFERVNQRHRGDGVLVVPTCVSWLHLVPPGLGYVVFGSDNEAIAVAETALLELLDREGIRGQGSGLASLAQTPQ